MSPKKQEPKVEHFTRTHTVVRDGTVVLTDTAAPGETSLAEENGHFSARGVRDPESGNPNAPKSA